MGTIFVTPKLTLFFTNIFIFLCLIQLVHTSWWYLAVVGSTDPHLQSTLLFNATQRKDFQPPQDYLDHKESALAGLSLDERCSQLTFLNERQKKFCARSTEIARIVGRGAQWGIDECQFQFRQQKWNCPTFNETSIFGNVLKIHGREKAFIYAISSAGVVISITRACARGQLEICGCDRKRAAHTVPYMTQRENLYQPSHRSYNQKPNSYWYSSDNPGRRFPRMAPRPPNMGTPNENTTWQWGGCSHDVSYGVRFTKQFINSMEKKETPDGLMNLWNNRVGRRAVKHSMRRLCKCHGVSGACTIQVCWRVVADIRPIGSKLLDRYEGAAKMRPIPTRSSPMAQPRSGPTGRNRRTRRTRLRLSPHHRAMRRPTRDDLVYLDDSPDYCSENAVYGSLGTSGRECSVGPEADGVANCEVMCCNRGFYRMVKEIEEDCDCKFEWCCQVRCKRCKLTVTHYYCH